ncbi:hypothetical protein LIER_39781 [Lithospermum erythrorhizon]|uniref:Uncharacterized protein n=1 Tax=Lithospermum erythrorhizon TaxID=34254 RepID=A0AAV3QQS4_LITER
MNWTHREPSHAYVLASRGFWEWAEDVLSRCSTKLSTAGIYEADLYKLGGLPIAGHLMDEVVPSTECLSSSLGKRERILQPCRFILHAYHRLATSSSDRSVSLAEWICFWSSLPRRYTGPSTTESSRADSLSFLSSPRVHSCSWLSQYYESSSVQESGGSFFFVGRGIL